MLSPVAVAEVQRNLSRATTLLEGGRHSAAIEPLRSVVAMMPMLPEPHFHLAAALQATGESGQAEAEYRQAIAQAGAQQRGYPEAWAALGGLLLARGDRALARAAFEAAAVDAGRQAQASPDVPQFRLAEGAALVRVGRYEDALRCFQAAAARQRSPDTLLHLAQTLVHLCRYKAAIATCEEVLRARPGDAMAEAMRGTARLGLGRLKEGFRDYRRRWDMPNFPSPRLPSTRPVWRGEDVAGKTINVFWEQGAGDVIQFSRFVGLLAGRGAVVNACVTPSLQRLMGRIPAVAGSWLATGPALPDCDYVVAFMDLAEPFIGPDGLLPPTPVPYLSADAADVAHWSGRLADVRGLRVGLVWAGSPRLLGDLERSIALAAFASLSRIPALSLVSLQQGLYQDEPGLDLYRPGVLSDFADTAALIEALDLVISVDTAVAHLAGALGKPVWLMLPFYAEWRWGRSGETTPWYPTMRLFRQTAQHDWTGVVLRIEAELKALTHR